VVERSHCPHCGHQLSWYENIPLLSWLALGGKCRGCKAPISIQYPLVELLTALLFVACVWRFGFGWKGFGAMLLTGFLISLSGIDFRTRLLPDQLTLPLLWLGLVASPGEPLHRPEGRAAGRDGRLRQPVVGVLGVQAAHRQGRHGPRRLQAAGGAGRLVRAGNGVLPTILLSSLVGAVVGSIWLAAKGRDKATPIPFGPYLAIAGWISFMWGKDLVGMYMRFAGPGLNLPTLHRQTAPHE
jgi:leader peptidase (prepilin peptidase)/N-methyltransferase